MAAGVRADLRVEISAALSSGGVGSGSAHWNALVNRAVQFEEGTDSIGKADLLYSASGNIPASGTVNLDLAGTLTNPFGAVVTAAEIVAIYVEADAANVNTVLIGGASANAFNGPLSANATLALKKGEFVLLSSQDGWPVVAGTGDILKLANGGAGTAVNYTILIIGRSIVA